ncbi:MAG: endonuclease/exonuclease/phosphatase family protein [Bacteroidales bacterium]|jgi:endonuclease/exonuclease/phosphatase family metal-dependent hydrolase|nr:endonuclease/exonuclease/phosphatase family protein [Bacteroidales bacterium]MDY0369679.1 endonuclease/exonuclease/phosphatase family protein [Bacteroidales bacterium]
MKKIFKFIGGLILLIALLFGVFLLWISQQDYMPSAVESVPVVEHRQLSIQTDSLSFISWNIGYAGLDVGMDFFYDGGKKTRTDELTTRNNLNRIIEFLQYEPVDFILLQEVDFKAKRSYRINQADLISLGLSEYNHVQVVNYDVPFVPVPLTNPMGQVYAGMMTLTAFSIEGAMRYAYPQIVGWPDRLFLLDRCFIETRHRLPNGADLVILNTHNSAFVADQQRMQLELNVIKTRMLEEYEAGNYVLAGGDWNMNPPDFTPSADFGGHHYLPLPVVIPDNMLPATWQIAFDTQAPSNRHLDEAYAKGSTGSTTIDFFIVSPNIELLEIKVIDLNFENSDHNPVQMKIRLKNMFTG